MGHLGRFRALGNRKSLKWGLLFFPALSLSGLVASFFWKGNRDVLGVLHRTDGRFLGLMVFLIGVDWMLCGARVFLFTRKMSNRVRYRDCFRANLAAACLGAVTPAQTGASAAQIYILNRAGLPVSAGAVITVLTFLSTLLFLFVSAVVGMFFFPDLYAGGITLIIRSSFALFGLAAVLFLLCLLRPDLVSRLVPRLQRFISDYQQHVQRFVRRDRSTLFSCVVLTFFLYFNKFLVAYSIVRALGVHTSFWHVIFSQVVLLFITYFAPTPGASGIAELSATLLMVSLIPPATTPYFTLLWRFSNTYLAFGTGGWIVLAQMRKDFSPTKKSGRAVHAAGGGRTR